MNDDSYELGKELGALTSELRQCREIWMQQLDDHGKRITEIEKYKPESGTITIPHVGTLGAGEIRLIGKIVAWALGVTSTFLVLFAGWLWLDRADILERQKVFEQRLGEIQKADVEMSGALLAVEKELARLHQELKEFVKVGPRFALPDAELCLQGARGDQKAWRACLALIEARKRQADAGGSDP